MSNGPIPTATFIFTTQVDVTPGFNAATAYLRGLQYAADNAVSEIDINGIPVYLDPVNTPEEFQNFLSLGDLGVGDFHSGINTIEFKIKNYDSGEGSPMAFRAEGAVVALPVPEPSSIALLAIGAIGLAGVARRAKRSRQQRA